MKRKNRNWRKRSSPFVALPLIFAFLPGCATHPEGYADNEAAERAAPITNPFAEGGGDPSRNQNNVVLRSTRGDRSMELQLPENAGQMGSLVFPVSPAFKNYDAKNPGEGIDASYLGRKPVMADHEITARFPKSAAGARESERHEIERTLGVMGAEDETPKADQSYLAEIDHAKQLYKLGRHEAALLEVEDLLRIYPTNPRLYQMRGTLLDRLGNPELAMQAWIQALKLDPTNIPLKRFIERKEHVRGIANDGRRPR